MTIEIHKETPSIVYGFSFIIDFTANTASASHPFIKHILKDLGFIN